MSKELQEELEQRANKVSLQTIIKSRLVKPALVISALLTLGGVVAAEVSKVRPTVSPYGEHGPLMDFLDKDVVQILEDAKWHIENGSPVAVARKYKEAAQADPNNHYLWAMLGRFVILQQNLLARGESEDLTVGERNYFFYYDMKGIWERAYKLEPDTAEYVANWAYYGTYYGSIVYGGVELHKNAEGDFVMSGRTPQETILLAQRAIELGDESGKADAALGKAYIHLQQWDNAIFWLTSSLDHDFIDRGYVYLNLLQASKNAGYEIPDEIVRRALEDLDVTQDVKIRVQELLNKWNN